MRMPFAAPALALSAALALVLSHVRARADVARELIVAFAPDAPPGALALGHTAAGPGLRALECLANRLPPIPSSGAAYAPFPAPAAFDLDPARVWLFEAPDSLAAARALRTLAGDPAVAWVERNLPRTAQVWSYASAPARSTNGAGPRLGEPAPAPADSLFPDDPLFRDGRQWGLENRGDAGPYHGTRDADVRAREAWRLSVGANRVVLAIADTGIDPDHPDLAATLPDGTPRIEGARDVVADGSVRDLYGHGTPVAGVAAARINDGVHLDSLGMAGVCGGDGSSQASRKPLRANPRKRFGKYLDHERHWSAEHDGS